MLDTLLHLADQNQYSDGGAGATGGVISGLIGYILTVIGLWPTFKKGGWPGWMAIIPIVNTYVIIKLAGSHGATILLYLIPIVNIVWGIYIAVRLGTAFGKGGVFSFFLLWLLAPIGYLILGYGSARYAGEAR